MSPLPHRMMRTLARLSLRTQMLLIATGLCVASILVVVPLYLHNARLQTEQVGTEWAQVLSVSAALLASDSMADHDPGTMERSLREVLSSSGALSVQVVRSGGQPLMRLVRRDAGQIEMVPLDETGFVPSPGADHATVGDRLHAYASLDSRNRGLDGNPVRYEHFLQTGWVDLEVSVSQRMAQARMGWASTALGVLLLAAMGLTLFALFLRRIARPLRELARYAGTLAQMPGETLHIRWGSHEVRELGHALNWSSQELARRMEETRNRLKRMRAILDTAADAIVAVDEAGNIVSANPAAERMFGLSEKELQAKSLASVLPGMDAQRLQQCMVEGMVMHSTQSRIGRVEMDATRHGGTQFPVEVLLGEISDDPEIRYTGIVRDLTDMKLAEDYLTLYGRVLDCTPNGISVSDARRYPQPIVHVNPAFTRITGYAPHEILGRDASFLEGPLTDPSDLAQLARAIQNGGEVKLTLHNYRKNGTLFHNKLSVSPVRDAKGEITHYINVIEDVTAQVEVKQRLIERTARLNATFSLSPDGFAVFDTRSQLITRNPALRRMLGEVPPWMEMSAFDLWVQQLCEEPESYLPISLDPGERRTLLLSRPSRKVIEREVRRHLGGSGETFVYFRDVTHQFEVDQMKSEFLATAAHELRTPLASILGFTELMLHRRYSEEKQKDLLQTVHRQGTLLNNLIQELLDLSRIEARQGKDFHIVATPLSDIVNAAISGITHSELGRQVHIDTLPSWSVMADTSKIEQALINLLSNAFKYSPEGSNVHLSVSEADKDGQAFAVISVQDSGIGMTPDQLARAFERFYRADSSGNIPGTGLGLNLVKEIAEIHGGSVELRSEPGQGTVASLWLRLAPNAVTADEPVTA